MLNQTVTDWPNSINRGALTASSSQSSSISIPDSATVTIAGLPRVGVVRKLGSVSRLQLGDIVTLAELQTLEWLEEIIALDNSNAFSNLSAEKPVLYVRQGAGPTPIGKPPLPVTADRHFGIVISELPTNGTVLLSDGITPLAIGRAYDASQLAASLFVPKFDSCGNVSVLRYQLRQAGRAIAAGSILFVVGPDIALSTSALTRSRGGSAVIEPLTVALLVGAALSSSHVPAIGAPADQNAVKSGEAVAQRDVTTNVAAVRTVDQPKGNSSEQTVQPKQPDGDTASPVETTSSIDGNSRPSRHVGSSSPPVAGSYLKFSVTPGDDLTFAAPAAPGLTILPLNTGAAVQPVTQFVPVPLSFLSNASVSSANTQTFSSPVVTPPVVTIPASPVAKDDVGFVVRHGSITISASTLLANDVGLSGAGFTVTGVGDSINGTASYDAATQSVSFVPTSGYNGAASFKYSITDANGMTSTANVSLYAIADENLFGAGSAPGVVTANDPNSVELGVQFTAAADGLISGLRFYKGPDNTGPHIANLWSSSGTLLATATFTNETASGWQQVDFSTPVAITAGTTYMASYHTNGNYSADPNYFSNSLTNADLTASGSAYAYGSTSLFPDNSFNNTNYWVDVVYSKLLPPPSAHNDGGLLVGENGSIAISDATLLANDSSPSNLPLTFAGVSNPTNGTVSYDSLTHAVTFVPTAGYEGAASFNYAVTDGGGGGVGTGTVNLLVGDLSTQTLFGPSSAPAIASVSDPNSVELGFKFETTANGEITGMRFFKGPDNIGPHVANLWSSTGSLLATATFTNETATGWQQVDFANPVAVAAGTTYIASYHSDGNYSADPNFFASAHTNGMLIAPATSGNSGNGVYAYGSSSLFPTNSYNSTGYGVDVLFKAQLTS